MELKMDLNQQLVISQHLVQSMDILQMSAQELESYIEKLSLENPVIELPESPAVSSETTSDDLQRKLDWLESTDQQNKVYYQQERSAENAENNWHDANSNGELLSDYLLSQLLLADYTKQEREIIEFIIYSLDDRGYFTDSAASVAQYFSVHIELVNDLLAQVQALDPAGVGAHDLKECLLLQIKRANTYSPLVEILVSDYLEDIARNHIQSIVSKLHLPVQDILAACEDIRSLNPKPGNSFSSRETLQYISPDAIVVKLDSEFKILINEYQYPNFSINQYYQNLLSTTTDTETKEYLTQKLQQAKWVTECISQRSSTLSRLLTVLVEKQNRFFIHGIGYKQPLKLSDIAEELELHESTISRAMRGKYLQCSWGIFPLNYFLSSGIAKTNHTDDAQTPEQVKALIQQIIDQEDKQKPLSDQAISKKLEEQHLKISRRTVNKYRSEMGLPDKSGRKLWTTE